MALITFGHFMVVAAQNYTVGQTVRAIDTATFAVSVGTS